ncbi:unnamed protein product [Closterium sp. Yama58-4]|nr:unnamed protein product [Closterium sp. Yama58-4]
MFQGHGLPVAKKPLSAAQKDQFFNVAPPEGDPEIAPIDPHFPFQYSYSETPSTPPIGYREPPFSPFGPATMSRPWTGRAPLKKAKKGGGSGNLPRVIPEFDSFVAPRRKRGVKGVQPPGPFGEGEGPRYVRTREEVLGAPLTREEIEEMVADCNKGRRQVNLGRDGLIHNMLELIHTHWKRRRCVKVKCKGVPTVDMDNVCRVVEDKTGGRIIKRQGGTLYVFRGRNYNYRLRPRLPLMLWKPPAPIYPKLIQDAPGGLTLRQAQELRRIGRKIKPLCKLGKNGVYHRLVGVVRAGFEEADLVRVDCKGMNKSDYKKIGAKLRDLVPCVLLSFEKEQILMWRGLDSQEPSPAASPESSSENSTQAEGAIAAAAAGGEGNNPTGETSGWLVVAGSAGMGAEMEGGEVGGREGVWKFDVEDEGEVEVSVSVDADGVMVVGGEEGEEEGGEEVGGVDGDGWDDEERWEPLIKVKVLPMDFPKAFLKNSREDYLEERLKEAL